MVAPYLETPGTEIGNDTYIPEPEYSVVESFPMPGRDIGDLVKQTRGRRGFDLKTPRQRAPFADRRNVATRNEFTPLLKSAARNRLIQRDNEGKENGVPQTPALFKPGYKSNSPALPVDSSVAYGEETGSSAGDDGGATPVAPVVSSSAMSTPMPILSRKGEVIFNDGNLLTLKEQEGRIAQIDKENFSLKLRIHFLEENLQKSGKEFNETAIRENTELKVDKLTLQVELKQHRKSLAQAEKDLEGYRKQLQDYAQKVKRRHADEGLQEELDRLQKSLDAKNAEIEALQTRVQGSEGHSEDLNALKGDVGDLEAELREKERMLDDKDDEVQALQEKLQAVQAQFQINADADRRVTELQQRLQDAEAKLNASSDERARLNETRERDFQSIQAKVSTLEGEIEAQTREHEKVTDTFKEQIEMMHSAEDRLQLAETNLAADLRRKDRVIEEKDHDIHDLQQKLQANETNKVDVKALQEEIADLEADLRERGADVEEREDLLGDLRDRLQQASEEHKLELTAAQRQIADLQRQQADSVERLQQLRQNSDQAAAQRDGHYDESQKRIRALEEQLQGNEQHVQALQDDIDHLEDEVATVHGEVAEKDIQIARDRDSWANQKRDLETQKMESQEKVSALQRTIKRLQEAQGTLSGREEQLQEAVESEMQRHKREEVALNQKIVELKEECDLKSQTLEGLRSELASVKDRLTESQSREEACEDKVQGLEDEIEVLQASIDEERELGQPEIAATKRDCESLRSQVRDAEQKLNRIQTAYADARAEIRTSQENVQVVQAGTPKADLHRRVEDLTLQLSKLRGEKQSVQQELTQAKAAGADVQADYDALQLDLRALEGSKVQLQQRLQDTQSQLAILKREKHTLHDELASTNHEMQDLRDSIAKAQAAEEEARRELSATKKQLKEIEHEMQRKIPAASREHQERISTLEKAAQQSEAELSSLRSERDNLDTKHRQAEQTTSRLRSKIQTLEQTLREAQGEGLDRTIAEERKDLHELLKDAKLEAEDLALRISERDARIEDLRTQLTRLREERRWNEKRADAVAGEMQGLKQRYDDVADDLARSKSLWEEERRLLTQRANTLKTVTARKGLEEVDKGNMELQRVAKEAQDGEKRHGAEIKGLVKQIQYLRAKVGREEGFRSGLCWQKRWFLMQVEMFGACNRADLHLLSEMGITPSPSQSFVHARTSLRVVATLVVATVRMRRLAKDWEQKRKAHQGLIKTVEAMRGRRAATGKGAAKAAGLGKVR